MADYSFPSPTWNSRAVSNAEYEMVAGPGEVSGLIGLPTDPFVVYADGSARAFKVRANRGAKVLGRRWQSDTVDMSISLDANTSGSTRTDLCVIGLDRSTWAVSIYKKNGTPGAGPPATQNDLGSTGKYEIPVATGKLTNGKTVLDAADVTPVGWFLSPGDVVCTSHTRPPHAAGLHIFETDTGHELTSNGSNWSHPLEDTGWTNLSLAGGWVVANAGKVRKNNGRAEIALSIKRTGAALTGGVDTTIATLPAGYAPSVQIPVIAYITSGAAPSVCYVNPDGTIQLVNYGVTVSQNAYLVLSKADWPIG